MFKDFIKSLYREKVEFNKEKYDLVVRIYDWLDELDVSYDECKKEKAFTVKAIASKRIKSDIKYYEIMDKFGDILSTVVIDETKGTVACVD